MTPTVSVILTAYNYGRYLAGALESVLGQTFGDLEVIVIDDGSTDDTGEVVASYLADHRVRYYRTDRRGQAASKNLGLRAARASLIAFLDADDLWLPHKLERQIRLLRADPSPGVVYTRRLLIDEQGRLLEYEQPRLCRGLVVEPMFQSNFVCFSSSLVRRRVFETVGVFDETIGLAVDYEMWLRVAPGFRFDYVDEALVKYRTGHANLSRRVDERLATVCSIMNRFLNERGGRALVNSQAVRRAWAAIYYHRGLLRRDGSRLAALPWYVRALAAWPGYGLAWRGLASLPLPESLRRWLRRVLGKPIDWTILPPAQLAANPSSNQSRRLEACQPHG